jgi:hypothetical protein
MHIVVLNMPPQGTGRDRNLKSDNKLRRVSAAVALVVIRRVEVAAVLRMLITLLFSKVSPRSKLHDVVVVGPLSLVYADLHWVEH